MSDDLGATSDTTAAAPDLPAVAMEAPASFGARLKWERERQGLSIGDVAGRLRLHPNQVRALEQEALSQLPEAAYVRGFVRSYARVLNADPAPVLADLAQKLAPPADSVVDGMVQTRDYSPVRAAAREHASRRFVLAGAVLLLLALGGLGWYATTQRATPAVTAPASAPPTPSAPAPAVVAEPAPAAPPAVTPAAPESAVASDSATLMAPVPPAPLLKLRFTGPSWVEVKDAEGKVLLSQHSAAGAEHVIEGTPPYYVVVGDAGKAAVEVRGEAFDLAPHTRQNVARFTVN
jgi:cytoskeleton protein RodZ